MSFSLKNKKTLLSGGAWAFIGKFSTSILTLAINAFLARMLVAEDLGIYFLAFNIAIFGAYIGTLGFEQMVVRFVAEGIGKNELKNVFYIIKCSLFATAIGAAIVGTIYFYSSEWLAITVFQSVRLSSISIIIIFWVVVNSFQILLGETFRGFHDIRFATIFGGFLSTAVFAFSLALLYFFEIPFTLNRTLSIWVLSIAFSNLLGLITLANKVKRVMKSADRSQNRTLHVKKVFSTGLPLFVNAVALCVLTQCDLWIVGGVGDDKDVAIYGAAAKLTMLLTMPMLIMNSVVSPMIAEKNAQGELKSIEGALRKIAALFFIPSLAFFLFFLAFGDHLLTFIFGSSLYGSGALVLSLLALKQLLGVWNGATGTVLAMAGKQNELMKNTLWNGFFSIILAFLLGYFYGGVGVAAGFLIPNIISQIALNITLFKSLKIHAYADVIGSIVFIKNKLEKNKLREILRFPL